MMTGKSAEYDKKSRDHTTVKQCTLRMTYIPFAT